MWAVLCGALVAVDLGSKSLASGFPHAPFVDPVVNDELMLGLAALAGPLLIVASSLVVAVVASGARSLVAAGHLAWWVLPFGVAGFLGNVVDRLAFGHVRDWLMVGPTRWNVADLFLLIAIPMAVAAGIASVRSGQPDRATEHGEEVKQR